MRKVIGSFSPAADVRNYVGYVNFATYVGSEEEFDVFAMSEDDAREQILDLARGELDAVDVNEIDEGEWEVTIGWAGFIGIEETFTIYADSEEEAVDQAIEEASWDLEIVELKEER